MAHVQTLAGPVHDVAQGVLRARPEYAAYQRGLTSCAEFGAFLDRIAPALEEAGLPAEDVQFAKRYPRSEAAFVEASLRMLEGRGILPRASYDVSAYERAAVRARAEYGHGPFRTYIYPEEARLLFAVVDILRPSSIVALGSYYGYWAYWSAAAAVPHGCRVVLVDPDARAQAVAHGSFARLGLSPAVELATMTGEEYLARTARQFDCVLLDAEGSRSHPDPGQRGKCVYASLLGAALPRIVPHAHLVCHNILFRDIAGCPFFDRIIARNRRELAAFIALVERTCDAFAECTSTEGVGVGRFRGRPWM